MHIVCFLFGFVAFVFLFKNNYIRYTIIFLYISIISIYYKSLIITSKISIIILIIFLIITYINIKSNIILLTIIIITNIIPELSHIIFKEKTYLYDRLFREPNIFMIIIQLIKHCVHLVPYCMLLK